MSGKEIGLFAGLIALIVGIMVGFFLGKPQPVSAPPGILGTISGFTGIKL